MSDPKKKATPCGFVVLGVHHADDCPARKKPSASSAKHAGPAQVASESYRTGWEEIFGAKPTVGQA